MAKRNNKEYEVCKTIAKYMKLQYPHTSYHFDLAGQNLSKAQAGMMKAIQGLEKFPDFFLMEARGEYIGLFLEVKHKDKKVFKQDGSILADEHLQGQATTLTKLSLKGYRARFAIGFDECKKMIDAYMSLPIRTI